MRTVAALFVEKNGVYAGLPDVELWDEERDARLYDGPHPVVAHPPCQKWCQLAPLNASRLKNYHIGDDGGCFASALESVRTWGGVLEHPAYSLAWPRFGLPVPGRAGWSASFDDPGYTTEVSQVAYGHAARKRTWLYCVGTVLPELDWAEPPATMQVSAFGLTRGPSKWTYADALDKNKSNYTPPAFRDVLLEMARSAA
jgi:hypothetical protein